MIYRFEDCELDTRRCELRRAGEPCHVEPQVFDVLAYLLQHCDRVVTHEELLDAVWRHRFVAPATISSRMRAARQAVGDDGSAQRVIRTVRGRGFRIVIPVIERPDGPDPPVGESAAGAPAAAPRVARISAAPPGASRGAAEAVERGAPNGSANPFRGGSQAERPVTSTRPPLLIGRERESEELDRRWRAALAGDRQIVFISGEAGLGKTALVDAFLAQVTSGIQAPDGTGEGRILGEAVRIGRGYCLDHRGPGEPYMPVFEAFGRMGRAAGAGELVALLAHHAPTWLAQMPALVDPARHPHGAQETPGSTRGRMLREMVEAVEALAGERPLIFVFEDLHWSDPSTLDLIHWLAKRPEPARLLLIGTYRSAEASAELEALTGDTRQHGTAVELALSGWNTGDLRTYLSLRFPGLGVPPVLFPGAGPPPVLPELILDRTGGNPFFVELLLDAWVDGGALAREEGSWQLQAGLDELAVGLPDTLRAIIERQVDALAPADLRLLETAAVAGPEFAVAALAAMLQEDEERIEACLESLVRQGRFVRAAGTAEWPDGTATAVYAFSHQLYPEVLYGRLPVSRRVRLHRSLGQRLERGLGETAPERAGELAVHFGRGREDARAIHFLTLAARQALWRSAHHEALGHLRAAIELVRRRSDLPDAARRELELQRMYAPARLVTGGWGDPEAERAYARARELSERLQDQSQTAHVLYGLAYMHEIRGDFRTSQILLEERLRMAEKLRDPELAVESHELLSCSLFHQGRFRDALDHARRGVRAAVGQDVKAFPTTFDDNAVVGSHYWEGLALWFVGRADSALEPVREAIRLAVDSQLIFMQAASEWQAARLHQFRREPEAAAKHAGAALAIAERQGYPYPRALAWALRGWTEAQEGNVEAGITLLRRALDVQARIGAGMERPYCLGLLAECLLEADRPEDADVALDGAFELIAEGARSFFWEAELHRLRGLVAMRRERPGEAEAAIRSAGHIAARQGARALSLRSAANLFELLRGSGGEAEALAGLRAIHAGFTEGSDTPDRKWVRGLLGEA